MRRVAYVPREVSVADMPFSEAWRFDKMRSNELVRGALNAFFDIAGRIL